MHSVSSVHTVQLFCQYECIKFKRVVYAVFSGTKLEKLSRLGVIGYLEKTRKKEGRKFVLARRQ